MLFKKQFISIMSNISQFQVIETFLFYLYLFNLSILQVFPFLGFKNCFKTHKIYLHFIIFVFSAFLQIR